jgi:hypothetical protein
MNVWGEKKETEIKKKNWEMEKKGGWMKKKLHNVIFCCFLKE